MNHLLDHLKNKGLIWQADFSRHPQSRRPAGPDDYCPHLPGGLAGHDLVDIHTPMGIGELRLLLPQLVANDQDKRLLSWVAPPYQLNAEALHQAGLELSQCLIIRPGSQKDALWAVEQCLKSGACHSVLFWSGELTIAQVKRLQQACQQGTSQLFLLRHNPAQDLSLPVSLSLKLEAHAEGLQIQVKKCRGGWPPPPFTLDMRKRWPKLCMTRTAETRNVIPFSRAQAS